VKRYDPTKRNCYCARGLTVTECEQLTELVAGAPPDALARRAAVRVHASDEAEERLARSLWSPAVLAQLRDRHPLPGVCVLCRRPGLCDSAIATNRRTGRTRQVLRCADRQACARRDLWWYEP
jgi:hypothetical protein